MSRPSTFLLGLAVSVAVAVHSSGAELSASVRSFIKAHCAECHDAETKKGGLDLTALKFDPTETQTFVRWVTVHDRVRAGEMPPPKKERPPAKERDAVLKELSEQLTAADTLRQRGQGRVALRRLNRTEYENTVRDLFALPGLEVRDLLPEDERQDGFDKAGSALAVSSVHLRRYLEAADLVLDGAIAHQDKPLVWTNRMRRVGGLASFGSASFPINDGRVDVALIKKIHGNGPDAPRMGLREKGPLLAQTQSLGILTNAREAFRARVAEFSAFHSGYYRIRTSVWSFGYDHPEDGSLKPAQRTHVFSLTADGRVLSYLDAPSLKPKLHELVVWLNSAEALELNAASLWANFLNPLVYEGDAVAVDFVDIEGPLHDSWPPASHRRLFGDLPLKELAVNPGKSPLESYPRQPVRPARPPGSRPNHQDGPEFGKTKSVWTVATERPNDDAQRLLADFLPRAFRRPVPPEELAVYVGIARERIAAGDFFETAMRAAYRVALCSPDFLFLREPPSAPADPTKLDAFAVATRLSYFLWNSMPDDTLRTLAEKNQLNGKALSEQVDRMLADAKSDRFIEDFLNQWAGLREIDFTSPDRKLYPEFRNDLRDAMLAETRTFFRELLTHDLGVAQLVDSDFLCINQRLAEHYGIPGVQGSAIRRVPRPAGSPRGGLIAQAAILKVTANGTTTSPVTRGKWVIDRILGQPPSPPPPGTPAVDPDVRGATTIRQLLDQHRHEAVCASCHAKIDPPGFALESFDVIGGWRELYRFVGEKVEDPTQRKGADPDKARFPGVLPRQWEFVLNNVRLGLPVDASGVTSDGSKFQGIHEFKRLLLARQKDIARALVTRLILYATGAPVGFADRAQVEEIVRRSEAGHYGLRTLVREVVLNEAIFQRK